MALTLSMPEQHDLRPRITVFGVGGAGGNAVNNMIEKNLEGAEFVVANTDAQALAQNNAQQKLQLGVQVTQGLGAGARPAVGSAAAEESIEMIVDQLSGAHMCFITAGMGGGTGTGAAPIIARAAREMGILTVGVVTKPFQFEGAKRMRQAEAGVEELQRVVDTLIVIPNQNLFRLANEKTTFTEAFSMADDVLYQGVKGVTDLMVRPGIINLDFADIRSVMDEMGKAMMGTGEAEGEDRAVQAAEKAIANPLLDEISLKGARGVLINVTGGTDLTLFELDEAANRIRSEVDPEANIIVGSTLDPDMEGQMRVSVVATGIDVAQGEVETPMPQRQSAAPARRTPEPAPQPAQAEAPMGRSFIDTRAEDTPPAEAPAAPAPAAYVQPASQPQARQPEAPAPVQQSFEAVEQPQPTPQVEQVEPQPAPVEAAGLRQPGEPSPETIARLQAAVSHNPEGGATPRLQAERREPAHKPAQHAEEQSRFAINNLIHKMTGGRDASGAVRRPQQAQAEQPQRSGEVERDPNEIPAFLRRQAN